MSDGNGLAEALLGLEGFRVLKVSETAAELVVEVETTADLVGCGGCGTRAESQDRTAVEIRDLACFGERLVFSGASAAGAVSKSTVRPRPGPRPR